MNELKRSTKEQEIKMRNDKHYFLVKNTHEFFFFFFTSVIVAILVILTPKEVKVLC